MAGNMGRMCPMLLPCSREEDARCMNFDKCQRGTLITTSTFSSSFDRFREFEGIATATPSRLAQGDEAELHAWLSRAAPGHVCRSNS